MKQLLIPITNPIIYNNHSHGGNCNLMCALIITLTILYIFYLILTLFERDFADRRERLFNKREFILDLLIPFRGWFIWLKNLFKDKE